MSLSHGKLCLWYSSVLFEKMFWWCLISRTEHLNTSSITSQGADSFRIKSITPAHSIPKISTHLTILWGGTWKTKFVKTILRQEWTASEKKSDEFPKKCSIEFWTILMFELLLCCGAWNKHSMKKYSKTLILESVPPKEFYKLPVSVEKKSWTFPYFCKSYCQRKIGTFWWATLYLHFNCDWYLQ